MPAFVTHWRILVTTATDIASRRPGAESPLSLLGGTLALPDVGEATMGARIPSLCYLGAIGPDVPYLAGSLVRASVLGSRYTGATLGKSPWADLLHYNQSGDFLIEFMRLAAQSHSPELQERALAYALGYVTHIAGDIIVHPLVNSFAGAFHQQTDPAAFFSLGMHFWVEICQDAWTAKRFFARDFPRWGQQQWGAYLHDALRELTTTFEGESLLGLLQSAAHAVYGLSDDAVRSFGDEYRAGLVAMRKYLSGTGYYRLLYAALRMTPRLEERFASYAGAADASTQGFDLTFDRVVSFAEHVAAHLCALTLEYFESLLQPAPTEGQAIHYARLRADLKNWDLDTGHFLEILPGAANQRTRVALRHSWPHFAELRPTSSQREA